MQTPHKGARSPGSDQQTSSGEVLHTMRSPYLNVKKIKLQSALHVCLCSSTFNHKSCEHSKETTAPSQSWPYVLCDVTIGGPFTFDDEKMTLMCVNSRKHPHNSNIQRVRWASPVQCLHTTIVDQTKPGHGDTTVVVQWFRFHCATVSLKCWCKSLFFSDSLPALMKEGVNVSRF